ncbi:hypothetical protein, partial [Aliivibrio fischeri]|uniref:hypothetical protein n=1 Tax=Aliivibrio fischeri TaxID=668 RepID=UPI001BE4C089
YTRRSGFALGFVIKAVKFKLFGIVINVLCKRYINKSTGEKLIMTTLLGVLKFKIQGSINRKIY